MSWNEREDDYSSVAFWYQQGKPTFAERAPNGKERTLPNIERLTVYGRDSNDPSRRGPGEIAIQQLDIYSQGAQLLFMPKTQQDGWIEIPFEVKSKEPLRLVLNLTTSYDFGRYQASLDGVKLGGPMDFYSAEIKSQEFHLLDFWPQTGRYTLRLDCVGKNPASLGYYLGLESLRLRERRPRVTVFAHDRDKDWRKNPTVYP